MSAGLIYNPEKKTVKSSQFLNKTYSYAAGQGFYQLCKKNQLVISSNKVGPYRPGCNPTYRAGRALTLKHMFISYPGIRKKSSLRHWRQADASEGG